MLNYLVTEGAVSGIPIPGDFFSWLTLIATVDSFRVRFLMQNFNDYPDLDYAEIEKPR
jgi:hypothetical protein